MEPTIYTNEETYKCCGCKFYLPRDLFGGITRINDYCWECKRLIERAHREKNRERLNAQNRKYAAKRYKINRSNLVDYLLDHACIDCGESDPVVLEFDHRDPALKRRAVGDILGSWNWNTVLVEIKKCDVRCANCHRRKTHKQLNWYTKKMRQEGDAR